MIAKFPQLAACEAGLEQSASPVWVFEAETIQFVWANDAAVQMWRAPDRAELLARNVAAGAPEKVQARTRHVVEQVRAGKSVREEWTFYPSGEPTMVLLDLRGVLLADGRLGVLNQAQPVATQAPEAMQRALAIGRHSSIIAALVAADGQILSQNPAALMAFDQPGSWPAWFSEAAEAHEILRRALAGQRIRANVRVLSRGEPRWHQIDAEALRDPVTGELGVLIEHTDETAKVEAERLAEDRGQRIDVLNATLELVEQQRQEIIELSAPILDVGDQTLAVPIIGRLSDAQSTAIMTKLLDAVAARGVRHVILDVTGVAAVDGGSAGRLRQMARALTLLGATPMITGIRPQLAQELTNFGFDLDQVTTLRSLAEGLRRRRGRR
ncbi:RsbR, positive regulator of sigma-B [Enhygromyxa salina]|uniref:RsbR, positive regulator of sigma-B n=1 Tax=Enhygromyxa salina TaxID=215803 RepID=A0A0C2D0Z7_9BACT|nr:STAS domain-containing protein [Enhygromyxa salina]KIG13817.1 RsbR, positive regulator of sigma-B [Enhygromyxa salina]